MYVSDFWGAIARLTAWAFAVSAPMYGLIHAPLNAPLNAQVIPDDSLGTRVDSVDDRFEITGGARSGDGANLFHSFERLNLNADQVANFVTTPEIQNVLGRVTGGELSAIDGLIQVTGSSADLFLLNPAGIVFGENARLDVAGDFTATTASGVEFEAGGFEVFEGGQTDAVASWSEVVEELWSHPIAFEFVGGDWGDSGNSGTIVNFGELSVQGDANLNLFGGTVINAGTLTGGNVSVTAVGDGQTLQLSAAGNVLGLEVAGDRVFDRGRGGGIEPIALPELLTGGTLNTADALSIGADGVVRLSGAEVVSGDSVVTGLIDVSNGISGDQGGVVQVLGDRVLLAGANIDASGSSGGGAIYLGGEYQGGRTLPTATFNYVDAEVQLDASAIDRGDGGEVILWADDTTQFFGQITARGGNTSGNGGFVETSGADRLLASGEVDTSAIAGQAGLWLLDPNNITIQADGIDTNVTASPNFESTDDDAIVTVSSITTALDNGTDVTVTTGNGGSNTQEGGIIVADEIQSQGNASLTLDADRDIQINAPITLAGNLSLINDDGDITNNSAIKTDGNLSLSVTEGNIETNDILESTSGNISLAVTNGNITSNTAIETGSGNITLTATNGNINAGDRLTSTGGNITLTAVTSLDTAVLESDGGDITLQSEGNVNTDHLDSSSTVRPAGTVSIQTSTITVSSIDARSSFGGGDIRLNAAETIQINNNIPGESFSLATDNGGTINIVHSDGVAGIRNFVIGEAATNGTAGEITDGTSTIEVGSTIDGFESGSLTIGNITIAPSSSDTADSTVSETHATDETESTTLSSDTDLASTENTNTSNTTTSTTSTTTNVDSSKDPEISGTQDTNQHHDFHHQGDPEHHDSGSQPDSGQGDELGHSDGQDDQATGSDSSGYSDSGNDSGDSSNDSGDSGDNGGDGNNDNSNDDGNGNNSDSGHEQSGSSMNLEADSSSLSDTELSSLDNSFSSDYLDRFGSEIAGFNGDPESLGNAVDMQTAIVRVAEDTGIQTGVVHVHIQPNSLHTSLFTADGSIFHHSEPVDRDTVLDAVANFRSYLINPRLRLMDRYDQYSAQLYDWIIRPLEAELRVQQIDTLMFALDSGLRRIPLAALYDGEQYLVENYSLSLIPSLGLVDTNYQSVTNSRLQAMGASQFQSLPPLPAVPSELETLTNHRWRGDIFLNQDFTRDNIIQQRQRMPYGIVHIATHGEFNSGDLSNSFLQLWDERIGLDEIRSLGWNTPTLDLLVLSACQTALGDDEAELGFAGLAIAAGVKTAIASLWYVDDAATYMLMTELYAYLASEPIKAEALRAAQISMLNGDVHVEDGFLISGANETPIPVPENLRRLTRHSFSNPYFWAAFTTIGSPW